MLTSGSESTGDGHGRFVRFIESAAHGPDPRPLQHEARTTHRCFNPTARLPLGRRLQLHGADAEFSPPVFMVPVAGSTRQIGRRSTYFAPQSDVSMFSMPLEAMLVKAALL